MVRAQAGARARPRRRKWNQDCSGRTAPCERAICLRYGRLVTDLVDGRLLALLTTRYGASRSHMRKAKRYLGCELVHLCALTWVIPSRRAAGRRMRLRACLTSGLPAYLAGAGWPHCRSARASHGAHTLQQLVVRATKTAARRSRARAGACCVPTTS